MTSPIEFAIFDLLGRQPPGKSVAPEEIARMVDPEGWRRMLGQVRNEAVGLARQGRLVITRHNKPADPDAFKGVYRLKLPNAHLPNAHLTDAATAPDIESSSLDGQGA